MADDPTTNWETWQAMISVLKSFGTREAILGEPKNAVQNGLVCIMPDGGSVDETTLTSPREIHRVTLRRYENGMQAPFDQTEKVLDLWRAKVTRDFFGDFTMGGTMAYALPANYSWQYGYVTIESTVYRYLDINFAYRVDDRATFEAGDD